MYVFAFVCLGVVFAPHEQLASIFVPQLWLCVVLWYASFVVEAGTLFIVHSQKIHNGFKIAVPIDVAHMAERFGLLVMIVLGECVLGQIIASRFTSAKYLFHAMCGIGVTFVVHVRHRQGGGASLS